MVAPPARLASWALTPAARHALARREGRAAYGLLLGLALLIVVGGLLVAAAPFGTWFRVDVAPMTGISVPGHGMRRPVALDETRDPNEGMWTIGTIADGVPVTGLGVALTGIGVALLLQARATGPGGARRRASMLRLATVVVAGAAIGVIWTVQSWVGEPVTPARRR